MQISQESWFNRGVRSSLWTERREYYPKLDASSYSRSNTVLEIRDTLRNGQVDAG